MTNSNFSVGRISRPVRSSRRVSIRWHRSLAPRTVSRSAFFSEVARADEPGDPSYRSARIVTNKFARATCTAFVLASLLIGISTSHADDPQPATPAPAPFILQSVEETYSSTIAKAEAEVAKAEAEVAKARKAAGAIRLKAYKDRLVEVTKTGDFEKAQAVKTRIEQLEKDPESELEKPTKAPKRPRPKDTVKFGGHTYALIKEPATWHVAKRRCEEMGGHLACLETSKEAEFVATLCGDEKSWVGATDEETEGKWLWVNGSHAPLPPNGVNGDNGLSHCLVWFEGKWHDATSGMRFAYVCEWSN